MSDAGHQHQREAGRTMGRLDQLIDEAARLIEEIRQEAVRQRADLDPATERQQWPPTT